MPDEKIFPDEFVPNIEGHQYHPRWVKANPGENAKWVKFRTDIIAGKNVTPPAMATKYGKALVAAGKLHMSVTDIGAVDPPPVEPPPAGYTHRFATFNPATDPNLNGCLNRFQPAGSWWVPGMANGTPWPNGGGLHEISTPHGPGIRIVVIPEMNYTGAASDSDIGRFAAFHQTANFRNQSHIWEWTWRWPSSGNIGGWAPDWVTGEGLTFAQLEPGGGGVVGHHLFLDAGPPFRVRFGRHKFEAFSGWEYAIGPAFPADTYVHNRIEIKWTANTDGYIRVYTDSGSGFTKWVDFTGVTMPNGWDCWTVYQNVRKPATWGYTNTLEWINHRLTIV